MITESTPTNTISPKGVRVGTLAGIAEIVNVLSESSIPTLTPSLAITLIK